MLDVACGTGWAGRSIARTVEGVTVRGVDIAADLVDAARALASRAHLTIGYQTGDAESLPYEEASFDVAISTFGVMFASRPEAAARDLGRVLRRGGRLGLTTWKPDSTVFEMFKVMKPYMPAPPDPPPPSPFAWGSPERVVELLGQDFELRFEEGVSPFRAESAEAAWQKWLTCYGPTKTLASKLPPEKRERLRLDMIAFHERFRTELGISKPRAYLLTIGVRR